MKINFFNPGCQEGPFDLPRFGLCDNKKGGKAYTNIEDPDTWVAEVKNNKQISLIFTAIDKCVIRDNEYHDRGRCDAMITSDEHLYFIELKDQARNWVSDAIRQLESTIQLFVENHEMTKYKHKKAFACNRKYKRFQEIDNERNLSFFRKYKVRLDVQAEVIIV